MATRKPVVIVTGASRGLGLATTAILLKDLNACVVALSRTYTDELSKLASDDLLFLPCDVSDEGALAAALTQAEHAYGHIDALVLNAGILDPVTNIGGPAPVSEWRKHFDVNVFSLVTALQATLPALRKSEFGGRVVLVSSGAAVKGLPGWGPYNAGKAAVNSLCRTLAQEEPSIISVAVRPGMVDTDMQAVVRSAGASVMHASDHNLFIRAHAEGKLVKPADAGHVLAALALRADRTLNGEFVSWDSPECAPYRAK